MSTASASFQPPVRYLTVVLAQESYGIAALQVREIIRLQKITPVPQLPPHVAGVINLRGRVVPVMDLRVKFGFASALTDRTCIVVVQVGNASRMRQMGLIVDAVEEVVNLSANEILPPPEFGTRVDTSYLLGLARVSERVELLLNLERVVAPEATPAVALAG